MDDNTPPEVKALIDDVVERYCNKELEHNQRIAKVGIAGFTSNAVGGLFGYCVVSAALMSPVGIIAGSAALGMLSATGVKLITVLEKSQFRDAFTKEFNDIQNNRSADVEIYKLIFQSPKLSDLCYEHQTKIIDNMPVDKDVLTALVENPKLGGLVEFYEPIKAKIEQLGASEKQDVLSKLNKNESLNQALLLQMPKQFLTEKINDSIDNLAQSVHNLTQEHQKTQLSITQINSKINNEILPNIKSLKDNLDDVVKKQNYTSDEIKVLKDLMGAMEDKIDAIKDPSQRLAELEAFQELLKPLAEIAKEPEFINALKAMHKGYKIDVDFNRQLKVLQRILSEKLPNNEIAQEKIVKFAKGYQGALSQLYELAPGFSSSVLSTNVGKKATMIKMLSSALNTACGEVPVAKTGAALIANELNKMAASQSAHIINDIRVLGEVADGQTDPDNRADKDKKNVAFQVINQHVLHMATHLSEDPQKLNQLEEATLKSIKKLTDYHGKALEALRGIAEDINIINSGDASSGRVVSETLHQRIENITPIEEAACRMTASSLTSALPAFMQGTKSRTEREATIRAVECRNILKRNTPSNNNNQGQRPYTPHNRFGGNMGI